MHALTYLKCGIIVYWMSTYMQLWLKRVSDATQVIWAFLQAQYDDPPVLLKSLYDHKDASFTTKQVHSNSLSYLRPTHHLYAKKISWTLMTIASQE